MKHGRRYDKVLQGLFCIVVAVSVHATDRTPSTAKRPNFVIILCDDLGYGDLSCYGHPTIRTPHLDRLASQGVRLTDCYAAAPVCSPARVGMLTGRNPNRCSVYDWIPENSPMHLQRKEKTVATILRESGYTTAFAGKWHCNGRFNTPEQPQPDDHGFDYWFATQNNARPSHCDPVNFVRNGKPVGPLEGYSSTIIVDEALRWLETRNEDQPFCLFVWFHSPHETVATNEQFVTMYSDAEPLQRAEYYGNVTQMDHEVGKLLQRLDDLKLRDETFVLFTSDNGPETLNRYPQADRSYGSPGKLRGMKLHLYEGGIRVPGMIRWPGKVNAAGVSAEPVGGVDLLPTLCEIAGAPIPGDRPLDGASIVPILAGRAIERRVPLFWRYDLSISMPKLAMRDGPWKVLVDASFEQVELYNLTDDPAETTNMVDLQPERVRRMAARLRRINDEVESENIAWPAIKRD